MRSLIVGCGNIAATHIDTLQKLGHDIVAVCDIDRVKAENIRERYQLEAPIYEDYIEMLDNEYADVVHILTPHYLHAEMVIEVLGRDVNCLCEKPLFIREEEFSLIESAVRKSKAQLGVCFQHRFMEANKYIKSRVEEEGIVGASAFLSWNREADYYQFSSWRGKKETEGGALLINQAIHTIDQLIWFLGEPDGVESNICNHSLRGVINCEDTAELYFTYKDGKRASLFATNASVANFSTIINIKTEKEMYEFTSNHIFKGNSEISVMESELQLDSKSYWGYGHYYLIKDFYDCIANNVKFSVDLYEGAKAIKVILKAYN